MQRGRKSLAVIVVCAMVLALVGCNSGGGTGASTAGTSSAPAESSTAASTSAPAEASSADTGEATATTPADGPSGWKPERTVTFYLYAGAGGDTDTSMRALAAVWEQWFGVTFNVVNMTGGGGGLAANQVYNAPSDGYTLFGMAEGVNTMNVMGAFDYPTEVWDIMLLFGGYGCIGVPADSPYETLQDLLDASAAGENIRMSCASPGNIWHLKALQINETTDANFNILTYEGSNQAVVGLLSGEVECVVSSLGEQSENILGGNIRPLAIVEKNAGYLEGYGDIPSICDTVPGFADLTEVRQWNGVGMKADMPQEIKDAYEEAFLWAITTPDMEEVRVNRRTELIGLNIADSRAMVKACDSAGCWLLYDLGLATRSPEEFDIARP